MLFIYMLTPLHKVHLESLKNMPSEDANCPSDPSLICSRHRVSDSVLQDLLGRLANAANDSALALLGSMTVH